MDKGSANDKNRVPPRGDARQPAPAPRGRSRLMAEQQARTTEGQGSGGAKKWLNKRNIIIAVISVIVVSIGAAGGVFAGALRNPYAALKHDTNAPITKASAAASGTPQGIEALEPQNTEAVEVPPDYNFTQQRINILVLGTDANQERIKQGMNARTDSIMLVSVELDTKKVSIISIPRDSYTKMYGAKGSMGYYGKINAAFSYGGGLKKNGLTYTTNTVRHFLGNIPIDYYVLFDMDLVKSLINSIGGLRYNMDMDVTIDNWHFTKGWTTLTGDLALRYARDRHHTPGGDFGRVDHQQKIMVALFEQLKAKKQLSIVPKLYESLSQNITTNMDALQIAALAWFARDLDISSVNRYTISGSCYNIGGSSVVLSDQQEKAKILLEVFGIKVPIIKEESASYLKKKVDAAYNQGKNMVSIAENFLSANTAYYSADEARGLKSAISAWYSAKSKNDADKMQDALDDVESQYIALKALVDERKNVPEPTEEPTTEPTDNPTDQPTDPGQTDSPTDPTDPGEPTPDPTQQEPTDTSTPTHTSTPQPTPEPTQEPAPDTTGDIGGG